ncbi:hypothetical protein DSECCO2_582640 [anaerobic digester metagenome]
MIEGLINSHTLISYTGPICFDSLRTLKGEGLGGNKSIRHLWGEETSSNKCLFLMQSKQPQIRNDLRLKVTNKSVKF